MDAAQSHSSASTRPSSHVSDLLAALPRLSIVEQPTANTDLTFVRTPGKVYLVTWKGHHSSEEPIEYGVLGAFSERTDAGASAFLATPRTHSDLAEIVHKVWYDRFYTDTYQPQASWALGNSKIEIVHGDLSSSIRFSKDAGQVFQVGHTTWDIPDLRGPDGDVLIGSILVGMRQHYFRGAPDALEQAAGVTGVFPMDKIHQVTDSIWNDYERCNIELEGVDRENLKAA
jgi:hypothetical protein